MAAEKAEVQEAPLATTPKVALIASLGDAEGGICPLGQLTYLEQKRKGYEVKETTFRQLKFKEAK